MTSGSSKRRAVPLLTLMCLITFNSDCSLKIPSLGGPVDGARLADGIYEGSSKGGPVRAEVRVTIKNQRITDIELVKHDTWRGKKAEPVIPKRIIEKQSTDVETVTGATVSSRVIMNAVQGAVEKATK
ncbi:FMN-binding protein [candidate division KSB1 bacterium]